MTKLTKEQLVSWLQLEETKEVFKFLRDFKDATIKIAILRYHDEEGTTIPISDNNLDNTNHALGRVEGLSMVELINWELIASFYGIELINEEEDKDEDE